MGITAGRLTSAGNIGDRLSEVCARLAATTAARAITEPEERSIPVVMITWVTPTAMMPIIATCSTISTSRLVLSRNDWSRTYQPAISKVRAITSITTKMPVSFGILCRKLAKKEEPSLAGAAVNFILLILCASMGCQRQNGFLVGFVFFQDAGDTTFMHHHDPIAHAKDFRQFRGDHNHRHPRFASSLIR